MGKNLQAVIGMALAALLVTAAACNKDASSSTATDKSPEPSRSAFAVPPPVSPPPDATSKVDMLLASATLADALEIAKPDMSDTDDETSLGAIELAVWATAHLRWSDVAVAKNETSFALVRKDPDPARGKRVCVRGTMIQIQKESLGSASAFTGLLLSGYSDIVNFIAVGSTGDLVQQSETRICGVVIGTYDYSNSAGGKGHGITVVGMFDLPENRRAAR